ncbi:16S rRNA (uracil(1498)-N(3))-methyltransferase [bacterium]|nr:16S rRNA (uracil(1498)-N(3))-methyltransferase [bacterium]MBU1024762.1 16S rRNA (uracil(1498)-N(3))-methyltransferase [bacterium]
MDFKHPRIYLENLPREGEIVITGEKYYHLARSVRARPADEFQLFNGKGLFADAKIDSIDSNAISATITHFEELDNTPNVKLTLAFGLLPAEPMKTLIAGATQLGVSDLIPFISKFSDIQIPDSKTEKALQRWRKLIIENSAIASRSHLPKIEPPGKLTDVVKKSIDYNHRFTFWEEGGAGWQKFLPLKNGRAFVVVGPKGGLSEDEISMLKNSGFEILTLGDLILKAEIAAVAACARIIGG